MWFLLEGLDSMLGIMEGVAVILADELKDQGTFFPILSLLSFIPLPRCQPLIHSITVSADRSFNFVRKLQ